MAKHQTDEDQGWLDQAGKRGRANLNAARKAKVFPFDRLPEDQGRDMSKLRPPQRGEKIGLIKQLLTEFPDKGNVELVPMFNERAAAQGIDMKTRDDGQEIAQARSAMKKAGQSAGSEQPAKREPASRSKAPAFSGGTAAKVEAPAAGPEPTASELMKVRFLVESRGNLPELLGLVTELERLAEEVGGLPRLRACLEFWSKVEGEQGGK